MMHTHILKTAFTEYIVVTDLEEWDWMNFFDSIVPECTIEKITTTTILPDGTRSVREFTN